VFLSILLPAFSGAVWMPCGGVPGKAWEAMLFILQRQEEEGDRGEYFGEEKR